MFKLNVKGFTVVEAMVSVAIVSVVALSVVYLLNNGNQSSTQNSIQSCQQLADATIESIRSAGNSGSYDYTNSNNQIFSEQTLPRVIFLPLSLDRGLVDPISQSSIRLEQTHITTMAGLDQLYNAMLRKGQNICNQFIDMPHFKPNASQLNHSLAQATVSLRIRPIDKSTSQPIACNKPLFTRPNIVPGTSSLLQHTPQDFKIDTRDNVGYLVEVQVAYPDTSSDHALKTCSSSQKFFHGQEPPLPPVSTQPPSGPLATLRSQFNAIACDAQNYLPDASARFKKSKIGNAFLCKYSEQFVPAQPALQLPDFCLGKGCPGLQTRQFNISPRALTTDSGWFDCRELASKTSQCVGGSITTAYDSTAMEYTIRVPKIAEHCQIKIDVAEVDYALNISPTSAQALFEHYGRRPGNFSCQCQAADGSPRNWFICDSRYSANDCPRPTGIVGTPSESISSSPVLTACECFPNSCACNPSLCPPPEPPEPPEPIEPGNGGGGGGGTSSPTPSATPTGGVSGTPTPTPSSGPGTPSPTPTPSHSACESCMRNFRSCTNSCARSCQSSPNPSSCQNNCASSCGGCDRQCQVLTP